MLLTTTPSVEGRPIVSYHGLVVGEAILGSNLVRDLYAAVRDIFGGRSAAYEAILAKSREAAIDELREAALGKGANGVVGVTMNYAVVSSSMLIVAASGTAVVLGNADARAETPPKPVAGYE
jgi:uncharacterized protein YbjQ (UPF0145 family)